ncbi:hypothetical protein ACHAXR_008082 [Thalassiosira sp. AJA248-18]
MAAYHCRSMIITLLAVSAAVGQLSFIFMSKRPTSASSLRNVAQSGHWHSNSEINDDPNSNRRLTRWSWNDPKSVSPRANIASFVADAGRDTYYAVADGQPSVGVGEQSCSENAFQTLSNLIFKTNEDPNKNAMIPLDITAAIPKNSISYPTETMMMNMPGLHLDSFKHKRIALLGDSTLFYMAKYLSSMLRHEENVPEGSVEYYNMNMDEANNFVQANKQFDLDGGHGDAPPHMRGDGTWLQWWGQKGSGKGRTEKMMNTMFKKAEAMRPEVVVANFGFHWLHLCGYSEKRCPTPIDANVIANWLHYKETWLQRVYDFATKMNTKVLLFKTSNFICGSARSGDWATGDELYQMFDDATISGCMKMIEPLGKDLNLVNEDIFRYCKYGQFTDVGSKYLNEQVFEFVRNKQNDSGDSTGGPIVGIFNDYGVESCSTTEDAIHHKAGIVVRVRLLANTIDSYLKCSNP